SILDSLDLSGSAITDEGLILLAPLPGLTNLGLAGTRVSVAGIDRFGDLRGDGLPECTLFLANTAVTTERLEELRADANLCHYDMEERVSPELDEDLVQPMIWGCICVMPCGFSF